MISGKIILVLLSGCLAVFLTACIAARPPVNTNEGLQDNKLTVGTVQKEIRCNARQVRTVFVLSSPMIRNNSPSISSF